MITLELHAAGIIHGFAHLDTHHNILGFGIFPVNIVIIVGGNQRNAQFLTEKIQMIVDANLLMHAMILHFKIIVVRTESILIPLRCFAGTFQILLQDFLRNLTG